MTRRDRSKRAPTPPITEPIMIVLVPSFVDEDPDEVEDAVAEEVAVAVAVASNVKAVVVLRSFEVPGATPLPPCPGALISIFRSVD